VTGISVLKVWPVVDSSFTVRHGTKDLDYVAFPDTFTDLDRINTRGTDVCSLPNMILFVATITTVSPPITVKN
jgi:hypothetical protein